MHEGTGSVSSSGPSSSSASESTGSESMGSPSASDRDSFDNAMSSGRDTNSNSSSDGGFGGLGIGNPGSYGGQQSVDAPGYDGSYSNDEDGDNGSGETASNNQHPQEGPFDQAMNWLGDRYSDAKNEMVEGISNTYDNINTAITETLGLGSAQDLIDDQLEQLNSDGDSAVFQLRAEGKAAVVAGIKGQYGFRVEVSQNGGKLPEGAKGDISPAEYEVSFDKRLLVGINIKDPVLPLIDLKGEANLRSSDRVTMTFDTREEAAQAVELLGRVAASETLRDAGSIAPSPLPLPPSVRMIEAPRNPLVAQDGGYNSASIIDGLLPESPVETVLNMGADIVAPEAEEMKFLTDHISGYTTHLDAQARAALGANLPIAIASMGGELRLDEVASVTRNVELPSGGEPGQVTYTFALEDKVRSKEGAAIGAEFDEAFTADAGLRARLEHASFTREISMSWEFDENQMNGPAVSGHTYPEVSAALQGDLGLPDSVAVRLDAGRQNQPIWDLSRADFINDSVELTIDQPGETRTTALQAALDGDLKEALSVMGENARLTITSQQTQRSGYDLQPEVKIKALGVGVDASLIMESGVDDVTHRNEWVVGGQPPEQPPTQQPAEASDQETVPSHEEPEPSNQVVVVPREGLTLRDTPAGQRNSVFYHGTFLDPTGNHEMDASGQGWTEVNGQDVNDAPVTGWVSDAHIAAHPEGAMNNEGRINPNLAADGYRAHRVTAGDNIWDIVATNGCDFQKTVALNAGHLIDPSLIFEGDVVYLPVIDPSAVSDQPVDPSYESPPSDPNDSISDTSSDTTPAPLMTPISASESISIPVPQHNTGSLTAQPVTVSTSDSEPLIASSDDATASGAVGSRSAPAATPPADTPPPSADLAQILAQYQVRDTQEPLVENYQPRFVREMQETNRLGFSSWGVVEGAGDLWSGLADMLEIEGTKVNGIPIGQLNGEAINALFTLHNLPVEEAALLEELGPRELFEMLNAKETAVAKADHFYPWEKVVDPGYGQNDGHNDAFRHTYWNALMSSQFGEEFTTAYATAHEAIPGNPSTREAMDLFNNELGRSIAADHPDASDTELAQWVLSAVKNGEALVIDAAGNLAWSNSVGLHQHGIATAFNPAPREGVIDPNQIVALDTDSHLP
jgi:hypothetical protein